MSLGGLVAYGDSDDSDGETSDASQNGDISNSETKSSLEKTNSQKVETAAVPPQVQQDTRQVGAPETENKSGVIGTVDDIEDDDAMPFIATPFNALKLPPPKHSSESGSSNFFSSPPTRGTSQPASTPTAPSSILDDSDDTTQTPTLLLAGLPAPKPGGTKSAIIDDEEDEIEEEIKQKTIQLKTKAEAPPKPTKRQPVKITVPELPQYDSDEDETPSKRRKKSAAATGKTGLFSLLPSPKNFSVKTTNRPLLPHTLNKKPSPATSKPKPKPKPVPAKVPEPKPLVVGVPDDDSDEEDEEPAAGANFFSLGESSSSRTPVLNVAPNVEDPVMPEPALTGPWQQGGDVRRMTLPAEQAAVTSLNDVAGPSMPPAGVDVGMATVSADPGTYSNAEYTSYPVQEEQSEVQQFLQDEEFLKLAGRRRRGRETIDFIDVQADHNITSEELTKHITEEVSGYSYSKKGKDLPSSQQRRKHQITYLAHQAKEREMELKNQWANNRVTKKQTQAKYGF